MNSRIVFTKNKPQLAEYYWAIYKDQNDLLDGSPEIVKVYFDGKLCVFRPGETKRYDIEDFDWWSSEPCPRPVYYEIQELK